MNGRKGKRGVLIGIVCVLVLAAALVVLFLTGVFSRGEQAVGKAVRLEDVTEFYYTLSSSTNPPVYQRYRFTAENGEYRFYHETREGDRWPLLEEDITRAGERVLTGEEWSAFFECIRGGTVQKRSESVDSGSSGPWLYLYRKEDPEGLEYAFPSLAARTAFEAMCQALREGT